VVNQLEVDPDQLRNAGGLMFQLYSAMDRVNKTLSGQVDGSNEPWGGDSYGSSFFGDDTSGYKASRKGLVDGLQIMTTTVRVYAQGMLDAADALRAQELASADRLRV
jgi:hypothetical protein